jgi:hypothetical protein
VSGHFLRRELPRELRREQALGVERAGNIHRRSPRHHATTGKTVTFVFGGNDPLARALRSNQLWLVVTYVGLILLMARAYA